MPYNLEVVINCLKRHYDLHICMAYLDSTTVLYPPPEGWDDEELVVDILHA
jgi:hypothetical protein